MGGLRDIFIGMSKVVGNAESQLANKINGIAGGEYAQDANGNTIEATQTNPAAGAEGAGADGAGAAGGEELSTEELLALQYDVQRFSIFNNMATSTMQTVAGAYQSVTGNLNFR